MGGSYSFEEEFNRNQHHARRTQNTVQRGPHQQHMPQQRPAQMVAPQRRAPQHVPPQQRPQRKGLDILQLVSEQLRTLKKWEEILMDIQKTFQKEPIEVSAARVFSQLEEMERNIRSTNDSLLEFKHQPAGLGNASRPNTSREIEQEIANLLKEIDLQEKDINRLKRENSLDMKKIQKEVEELKSAKEDALSRLSELSSKQLQDNNPNVTDLSDANRPTKLAEYYNELYDREWMDAFAVLTGKDKMGDEQAIVLLLATLTDVYSQCSNDVENLKSGIIGVFKKEMVDDDPLEETEDEPSLLEGSTKDKSQSAQKQKFHDGQGSQQQEMKSWDSAEAKKSISELAKAMAPTLVKSFEMKSVKKHKAHAKYGEELLPFVARCAHICFLMVIQTPPIVFHDKPEENNFNKDFYKPYTKTGSQVDYIVWPPLLLHKDGPLLTKGVAQGN